MYRLQSLRAPGKLYHLTKRGAVMSKQETIIQIMPATGWVAVYDEAGEESAESLVVGKGIGFADNEANFQRVEELAEFEEDEEEEEEDEEDGEE